VVGSVRRRRVLAGLATIALLAAACVAPMLTASADVGPAGAITVSVNATIVLKVFNVASNVPFTGTMNGTVDSAGNLSFAAADMSFPQTPALTLGGNAAVAKVTPVATGTWTGHIDPATGAMTVTGPMETLVNGISPIPITSCPVGPFTL